MPRSKRPRKQYKALPKPKESDDSPSLTEILLKPIPLNPKTDQRVEAVQKYTPWPAFCRALGTEFRSANEIHGQSGLIHPIAGLGIDEKDNRMIVISADHNPRVAAMMRMDVQASLPDMRVLVARPLTLDIPFMLRRSFYDESGLSISRIFQFVESLSKDSKKQIDQDQIAGGLSNYFGHVVKSDVPVRTLLHNVIDQIWTAPWPSFELDGKVSPLDLAVRTLNALSQLDNLQLDRENGLCPVPTYEFTEQDWEMLLSNSNLDEIQERLRGLEIFQYFFPSRDKLALGLIDRGIAKIENINEAMELTRREGHIFSENAILSNACDVSDMVDEFKRIGLVSEGEVSWEISDQGRVIRNAVKFRPSEGLISRVSKIVSFKVDISLNKLLGKG